MKRVFYVLLLVVVALAGGSALRALLGPAAQPAGAARAAFAVDDERETLERFAAAIRIATLSHQDPAQDDPAPFQTLRSHLERAFPRLTAQLSRELVNERSLLYRWQGSDASLLPIVLMAHQDVVPVEAGSEAQWTEPPFSGAVKNGFVWGRGTLDVKNKLIATCEAVERLLGAGFVPARTVYLAFGHDEEVGGEGAKAIAKAFQARGQRFEWVLDEGGTIGHHVLPNVERPIALVGIAEKGYLTLGVTAKTQGGHSSMPGPETAIGILAAAIQRLEKHPLPARMTGSLRTLLAAVAPEAAFPMRVVFANADILKRLVLEALAESPRGNANVRTTTAVTIVEGGVKENVLPGTAHALVNFRLLPGDSSDWVTERVRRIIDDPRVSVARNPGSTFAEASPESRTDTPAWALLSAAIRSSYPDAAVAPNLVLGATDARWYRPLSENVYRFSPMRLSPDDLKRIHGTDERVAVRDYLDSIGFYQELIRRGAGPGTD